MSDPEAFEDRREEMVRRQIAARGVRSPAVLDAMPTVQRDRFVPSYLGKFAYENAPLPPAAAQQACTARRPSHR